jgi:hypothetical protein
LGEKALEKAESWDWLEVFGDGGRDRITGKGGWLSNLYTNVQQTHVISEGVLGESFLS